MSDKENLIDLYINNVLMEFPMLIPSSDFNLTDPEVNSRVLNALMNSEFRLKKGENFYSCDDPNKKVQRLFMVDPKRNFLTFIYEWKGQLIRKPSENKNIPCCQIHIIWKEKSNSNKANIAFWNYVFKEFGVVLCDNKQTQEGRNLWKKLIFEAINTYKYPVYIFDLSNNTHKILENPNDYQEEAYGDSPNFMNKVFCISKFKL